MSSAQIVQKLWIYALRTNKDFTLKTNPLKRNDLDEFFKCYNPLFFLLPPAIVP